MGEWVGVSGWVGEWVGVMGGSDGLVHFADEFISVILCSSRYFASEIFSFSVCFCLFIWSLRALIAPNGTRKGFVHTLPHFYMTFVVFCKAKVYIENLYKPFEVHAQPKHKVI